MTRDRLTWVLYALLAFYAYMQSVLSPALNFLAPELSLSFAERGLHITLFAAGIIAAGLQAEYAASFVGRRVLLWAGGLGMAAGAVLISAGSALVMTLTATTIMGFCGGFLLIAVQALLSDHHGAQRAVALTEANIGAVVLSSAAAFAVGAAADLGLGWRTPLIGAAVVFALLWLIGGRAPLPDSGSASDAVTRGGRLPRSLWLYVLIGFLGVGVEWSLILWSQPFLEIVGGLSKPTAASALGGFFLLMVTGRFVGSRLAAQVDPARLLVLSLALTTFGFSLYWLAPLADLRLAGFLLCGLGIANVWPLTLAGATGLAPGAADAASARMSLGAGVAIFSAPQLLGGLADLIGIASASGVTGVLALAALVAALIAALQR